MALFLEQLAWSMTMLMWFGVSPSSGSGSPSSSGALTAVEAALACGACWANFLACSICICLLRSSSLSSPKMAYELSRLRTSGSSMTKMSPSLFLSVTLVIQIVMVL